MAQRRRMGPVSAKHPRNVLIRILLLLALGWFAWRLYRTLRPRLDQRPPDPGSTPDTATTYEPMARCARCGVHAPASALSKSGLCGRCGE